MKMPVALTIVLVMNLTKAATQILSMFTMEGLGDMVKARVQMDQEGFHMFSPPISMVAHRFPLAMILGWQANGWSRGARMDLTNPSLG